MSKDPDSRPYLSLQSLQELYVREHTPTDFDQTLFNVLIEQLNLTHQMDQFVTDLRHDLGNLIMRITLRAQYIGKLLRMKYPHLYEKEDWSLINTSLENFIESLRQIQSKPISEFEWLNGEVAVGLLVKSNGQDLDTVAQLLDLEVERIGLEACQLTKYIFDYLKSLDQNSNQDGFSLMDNERILKVLGVITEASAAIKAFIGANNIHETIFESERTLEPKPLFQLIKKAINIHSQYADEQGVRLHFRESSEDDDVFLFLHTRFFQLLSNLIENGIKFANPDSNTHSFVDIEVITVDDEIQISVIDNGRGVPEGELESIFEKGERGSNVIGVVEGTGLGLNMARRIIEKIGGVIWAEHNNHRGTTIVIRMNKASSLYDLAKKKNGSKRYH